MLFSDAIFSFFAAILCVCDYALMLPVTVLCAICQSARFAKRAAQFWNRAYAICKFWPNPDTNPNPDPDLNPNPNPSPSQILQCILQIVQTHKLHATTILWRNT